MSTTTDHTAELVRVLSDPPSTGGPSDAGLTDIGVPEGFRNQGDIVALIRAAAPLCVAEAAARGLLASARACDGRGLAVCVAECCLAGGCGSIVALPDSGTEADCRRALFGGATGQVVVSLAKERLEAFEAVAAGCGASVAYLGMVAGDRLLLCDSHRVLVDASLSEMRPAPGERR